MRSSKLIVHAMLLYLAGLSIMCALENLEPHNTADQTNYFVYVGTYGKGVYAYRFNSASAKLDAMGLVGEVVNPSFVTTDRQRRFLYAVSELEGKDIGGVAAFSLNRKKGSLTPLNSTSSGGVAPCHLAVDATGKMLLVANYVTGGVSAFPIEDDGRLGKMSALMEAHGSSVNPERQEGPHAHEVVVSADNRFLYVPDLGLDQIRIYRLDPPRATLSPNEPPFIKEEPGLGPRHMAFSPSGKFAYVVCELKSVVTVFSHDASTGNLKLVQTIPTIPPDFKGENGPAGIQMDRTGRFLYASNRGHDSVAVFAVDEANGMLRQIEIVSARGKFPRGFQIDPTSQYLFVGNQKSDHFVVFRMDPKTGRLTQVGEPVHVTTPVAFEFVPQE